MNWQVGNGESIHVVTDQWIDSVPLKWSGSALGDILYNEDMTVNEFIVDRSWDLEKLQLMLSPELAERIRQLPIPRGGGLDSLCFMGMPLCKYSTRNAYRLLTDGGGDDRGANWGWIWESPCSYRVCAWLWKAVKCALPTKLFLFRRGLVDGLRCPRCLSYAEDSQHLFIECESSQEMWSSIAAITGFHAVGANVKNLWETLELYAGQKGGGLRKACYIVYAAWEIWKQRNNRIFQGADNK